MRAKYHGNLQADYNSDPLHS